MALAFSAQLSILLITGRGGIFLRPKIPLLELPLGTLGGGLFGQLVPVPDPPEFVRLAADVNHGQVVGLSTFRGRQSLEEPSYRGNRTY